jgi:hypothetical protein
MMSTMVDATPFGTGTAHRASHPGDERGVERTPATKTATALLDHLGHRQLAVSSAILLYGVGGVTPDHGLDLDGLLSHPVEQRPIWSEEPRRRFRRHGDYLLLRRRQALEPVNFGTPLQVDDLADRQLIGHRGRLLYGVVVIAPRMFPE